MTNRFTFPLKVDVEVDNSVQAGALRMIIEERRRQKQLHDNSGISLDRWFTVLGEEVGEVANAILEGDMDNLTDELIQVAAVALAILEAMTE